MGKRGALSDVGPAEPPHYAGHRDRLRQKLREAGDDPLFDYEVLEFVLFAAIPRQDVKPLAKRMLASFDDDLAELFGASRERLKEIEGVGDAVVDQILIVRAAGARMLRESAKKSNATLSSWRALVDYCTARMARETTEQFRILFLDRKNKLLRDEVQNRGTIDHTPVYPREVVRRALELGAASLIVVHNHPT